ncbi:hypothetical protein TgHK011_000622 [Trichoderma gracile]|nr:hypothetical protein TgHK011_000622 [Trichoderma gracile]
MANGTQVSESRPQGFFVFALAQYSEPLCLHKYWRRRFARHPMMSIATLTVDTQKTASSSTNQSSCVPWDADHTRTVLPVPPWYVL